MQCSRHWEWNNLYSYKKGRTLLLNLCFKDIAEFEKQFDGYYPTDQCECGGNFEIEISTAQVQIADKTITVNECPVQKCQRCGKQFIGHRIPPNIYQTYHQFQSHPGNNIYMMSIRSDIRFEYAKKADFKYDSRDLNIPGCDADMDPTNTEGFSLPVYFDRKVLNNFYTDDDYELDFFSESYGDIGKKGTNGWPYEWKIPFGIDANDKVILFLGDLDQIEDDRSIMFLKSYNVPSDHILVETELYQAQLKCIFSQPIIEERIILLRDGFYKKVNRCYGIDLSHLENEINEKRTTITKPVSYTEREVSGNIVALDGILNEGISQDGLKKLCKAVGVTDNLKGLRTRKLLQAVIATKEGAEKAAAIVAPLFRLNDLRVCFAHLLPADDIQKAKERIVEAYKLNSFTEYRKLYEALMNELYELYKYLNVAEFGNTCT
jgi:hypothetical protein